jgi:hypothetical protein
MGQAKRLGIHHRQIRQRSVMGARVSLILPLGVWTTSARRSWRAAVQRPQPGANLPDLWQVRHAASAHVYMLRDSA